MQQACVIFDLDGTLIDSSQDITDSVNLLRSMFGLEPHSRETVLTFVGDGASILVERAFKDTPDKIEAAELRIMECYQATFAQKTTLYPGVKEGIERLHKAGFKLAVASNKPHALCAPLLEKFGILQYIDAVQGGGDGLPIKPDPAQLFAAMKKTNCIPEKSWMLGDNHTDLAAAQAAGCKKAYAAYGFGDPDKYSWDFKADSFMSFVDHLLS